VGFRAGATAAASSAVAIGRAAVRWIVEERVSVLTDFVGRRLAAAALLRIDLRAAVRELETRRDLVIGIRTTKLRPARDSNKSLASGQANQNGFYAMGLAT